jgi:hypothetical protein
MGDRDDAAIVKRVVDRANLARIPIEKFVERVTRVYSRPDGFNFVVKDFQAFKALMRDNPNFGFDDSSTELGAFAGSRASAEGFLSYRENNALTSLHVEVGYPLSNVHIDAVGIAPGRNARGANVYDLGRFAAHGIVDLGPELPYVKHLYPYARYLDVQISAGRGDDGKLDLRGTIGVRKDF